jgi:2',3'-cyclic-nucleotide 2'-phosphodiesterase (5'-nucleotidase family)
MYKFQLHASKVILALSLIIITSFSALSQGTTLHLIHLADAEASTPAVSTAPNFAALVDAFVAEGEQINAVNLILSSGDNYLPGPFFSAAGDRSMRNIFRQATDNPTAREGSGYADIIIHNLLGVRASAVGNHEFDLGTDKFADLMAGDVIDENEVRFQGADFPYLSSNLDFSNDGSLVDLYTEDLLNSSEYALVFDDEITAVEKKVSPWIIVTQDGVDFGIIGATTPIVESISSTDGVVAKQPGGGTNNMQDLGTIIQGYVDQLTQQGIDKIVILSHMQQLQFERELIGNLNDVDIIIAGGSNSILAEEDERLFDGDLKVDDYPIITETAEGDPALIVNTDGGYKYVGRLLIDFDENGILDVESLNREISGSI